MSDALAVTARELIADAEQSRDLAIGQARLLEGQVASLRAEVEMLRSELRPVGPRDDQRREFAERLAQYAWRSAYNAASDDDPPETIERLTDWLHYRLEQWAQKTT